MSFHVLPMVFPLRPGNYRDAVNFPYRDRSQTPVSAVRRLPGGIWPRFPRQRFLGTLDPAEPMGIAQQRIADEQGGGKSGGRAVTGDGQKTKSERLSVSGRYAAACGRPEQCVVPAGMPGLVPDAG